MKGPFVTSAELASAIGVTLSTIHAYTTLGLLKVRRRIGNRRLYASKEARACLKAIERLRQEGYSLAMIRERLAKGG